jgi:hypothetical protein
MFDRIYWIAIDFSDAHPWEPFPFYKPYTRIQKIRWFFIKLRWFFVSPFVRHSKLNGKSLVK